MADRRQLIIDLSIATGVGIVAALLGPLGSFKAPFAIRLLYWVPLCVAGYALYRPTVGVSQSIAERLDLPQLGAWIAAVAFATIPMSVLVWSVNFLPRPPRLPSVNEAIGLYGNVLVVGGVVALVFWLTNSRKAEVAASPVPPPPAPEPVQAAESPAAPFFDRLPPHLGNALIALEMEDHYVRAHTDRGSALILMRMRDAAAELASVEGMQVHRSWWVARGAVERVEREGRNTRLILRSGIEAPVARDKVAVLQAAGWF